MGREASGLQGAMLLQRDSLHRCSRFQPSADGGFFPLPSGRNSGPSAQSTSWLPRSSCNTRLHMPALSTQAAGRVTHPLHRSHLSSELMGRLEATSGSCSAPIHSAQDLGCSSAAISIFCHIFQKGISKHCLIYLPTHADTPGFS
ncbi:uncharacterized protein LOC128147694 isoform X2 [Harpia harpyja]|uniref:uncharacterized protein LOC128147694 isoform X2 n=1 Tax=Harpia harpyja TaxID=202280 RepID=UPI0022B12AA8|nr:uncharacterized protein LOC128147694 isoform X2 [Harpia harpyja]